MNLKNNIKSEILNEKILSDTMNGLHNAVIVLENCKILQTSTPWDIDTSEHRGDFFQKQGMEYVCDFLEQLHSFTKSEQIFDEQFLKPIQIIAKKREGWSNNKNKASTDLEGWVFSISKPTTTSRYSGPKITVSIVFPKLQSVMSLSISKETMNKTSSKYFEFTKCQPIGLVNRIHQVKGAIISKTNKESSLSEFNFLFTSFNDIKLLGKSIEMENFCEVQSQNSEIKQHMAFSFVSFGKILNVQGSQVTLEGLDKSKIITFTINSKHYYDNANMVNPKKIVGKYVRFFGVAWYNPNCESEIDLETPEIFLMQEENDLDRLKVEDEIGRIRTRNYISQSEIKKELREKIESENCIKLEKKLVYFNYLKSDDLICESFVSATTEIRHLRNKLKISKPIVTQEQVLDLGKMNDVGVKVIIQTSKILYEILMDYQMQKDLNGEYNQETTIKKLAGVHSEIFVKKKIWRLKYLGVFELGKNSEKITSGGKQILQKVVEEEITNNRLQLSEKIRLENKVIPPSIFLEYLRNSHQYLPLVLDTNKKISTEIFWIKKGTDLEHESLKMEYNTSLNLILEVMRSVSHSVTPQWISEELKRNGEKISVFVIDKILHEREEYTTSVLPDGDSWKYPVHSRLMDFFFAFPEKKFNLIEISNELLIPKSDREKTIRYLKDFEKSNLITDITGNEELQKKITGAYKGARFGKSITSKKIRNVLRLEENLDHKRYWMSTKNVKKIILIETGKEARKTALEIFQHREQTIETSVSDRYFSNPQGLSLDILVTQIFNQTKKFSEENFLHLSKKFEVDIRKEIENEINKMIMDDTLINLSGVISKKKISFDD